MEINSEELVRLARVALDGKSDEVAMQVRRIARRVKASSPVVSALLLKLLKKRPAEALGRDYAAHQLPVDLESRLELAKVEDSVKLASDPIWSGVTKLAVEQILKERAAETALAEADLSPARSMLFVGPPGVGKTLTARWLAGKLDRPLVTLDLAAVMSSFLGRTGNNLRNVLDYAKRFSCVLLLDEFDAIAKRRDDVVEVGELKRLVTVLLQEIDNWPATGLLIAATNHPELLDPAIWRRFDAVVNFEMPSAAGAGEVVKSILGAIAPGLHQAVAIAMAGFSFSEIERELLRAKRESVVEGKPLAECLEALIAAHAAQRDRPDRKAMALALVNAGCSQRRAHELTGVSRDTIRQNNSGE